MPRNRRRRLARRSAWLRRLQAAAQSKSDRQGRSRCAGTTAFRPARRPWPAWQRAPDPAARSRRRRTGTTSRPQAVAPRRIEAWRNAAQQLNALFHDPSGIYERKMQPGDCVIFDNRRVLHARKAFEVQDFGKERWLRGCYLDKDPFLSKARVLGQRFLSGSLN